MRVLTLLLALVAREACALNVLFVTTVPSPSHSIWTNALAEGLLANGHHVTELSVRAPPAPHPNRTTFLVQGKHYMETQEDFDLEEAADASGNDLLHDIWFFYDFCMWSTKNVFNNDAHKDLLRHIHQKRPKYDVLVMDYVMQEALIALNHLIGRVPVVAITAYNLPEDIMALMGSPYFPSLVPYAGTGAHGGEPMTFLERVQSTKRWLAYRAYQYFVYRPALAQMMAEHYPGAPDLDELSKDVAVSLVNTSPALHGAVPLVPGIVEVGGLQARPVRPLPADLEAWVNKKNAPNGFVFMSFGTNVRSANMSARHKDAILKAFGRIKQRVLWKYEEDDILDKLPPNVKVAKWLPQNDILGHPNIRCFVSHNGGLSTQEASYHGVPLVGVPFFADQVYYAEKTVKLGLGRRLSYTKITEETFYEALSDVLNNPRYAENMRRVRDTLRDQKETPLQRAVWWVEYAARSGGARHLRSPALKLRWYEVWMLDMAAVALLVVAVALYLVVRVLKGIVGLVAGGSSSKPKKLKTK